MNDVLSINEHSSSRSETINSCLITSSQFLVDEENKVDNEANVNESNEKKSMFSKELFCEDDDDYFHCPYCEEDRRFHSLRGLNIHIAKKHPNKKKVTQEQLEFIDYEFNETEINGDFGNRLAYLKRRTS